MSTAESGTWKLLLYPILIIFVIGVVLNLTITPFIESGISVESNPTFFSSTMQSIISTGNVFNMTEIDILGFFSIPIPNIFHILPDSALTFIQTQIEIYSWLPEIVQIPLAIIFIFCIAYALWVLIAMLIP